MAPSCWPALALAGMAAGIALFPLPDARVLALALVLLAAGGLLLRPPGRLLVLILAACAAFGYLRAEAEFQLLRCDPLASLEGRDLEVRGTVLESPRPRARGSAFRFRLERAEEVPELPPAEVLAESHADLRPQPGERWCLRGRLAGLPRARYPRGFDAGAWLSRQGIHHRLVVREAEFLRPPQGWTPGALAWRFRGWLAGSLEGRLPPEAQALVLGIALGEARGLPPDLQEAFRRSGTSHLLAASGLNVAVVTGMVFWLARRLGLERRYAALPALAAAAFYCLLAGSSPSIVRATAMAGIALVALAAGRTGTPWTSLLAAGLAVLACRPGWLWDPGFQLSMAAVAGLLAFGEPLERLLVALPRALRVSTSASLAATLASAPLLAWHFQQVSALAVLANLAMTPVAEALLPLGLAAAVLAGLCPPLAGVPLWLCSLGAEFLTGLARVLGQVVDPVRVPRPGPAALAAFLLAGLWLRLALAREGPAWWRPVLALAALGLASLALLPEGPSSGDLRARLADLPGGAVLWVSTPQGRELVLLESEAGRQWAEEVLALHGRGEPDAVYVLGQGEPRTESPEPGLRVESLGGALRLSWGRFSLLWASPQALVGRLSPGSVALLPREWAPGKVLPRVQPCLTLWPGGPPRRPWRTSRPAWWSTREQGPLELQTDGLVVRWHRWEG